jgi:hypothetical protein
MRNASPEAFKHNRPDEAEHPYRQRGLPIFPKEHHASVPSLRSVTGGRFNTDILLPVLRILRISIPRICNAIIEFSLVVVKDGIEADLRSKTGRDSLRYHRERHWQFPLTSAESRC